MAPGIFADLSPEALVRKHYSEAFEDQKVIEKVPPVNDIKCAHGRTFDSFCPHYGQPK